LITTFSASGGAPILAAPCDIGQGDRRGSARHAAAFDVSWAMR
jgi:hypothetical protein